MNNLGDHQIKMALMLLGQLLEGRAPDHISLVVCGGSALIALGLVSRATKDIDIVARLDNMELIPADPLPPSLIEASKIVTLERDLPEGWLNSGPAEILNRDLPGSGFPEGFMDRLLRTDFGSSLSVYWVSRLDQVHFKFYAAADQGAPSRHLMDLRALDPTDKELTAAARWARLHDPSEGFLVSIRLLLRAMEKEHVCDGL